MFKLIIKTKSFEVETWIHKRVPPKKKTQAPNPVYLFFRKKNKRNGIWGLEPRMTGLKIPRFGAGIFPESWIQKRVPKTKTKKQDLGLGSFF